jgi:hypothetical protein
VANPDHVTAEASRDRLALANQAGSLGAERTKSLDQALYSSGDLQILDDYLISIGKVAIAAA